MRYPVFCCRCIYNCIQIYCFLPTVRPGLLAFTRVWRGIKQAYIVKLSKPLTRVQKISELIIRNKSPWTFIFISALLYFFLASQWKEANTRRKNKRLYRPKKISADFYFYLFLAARTSYILMLCVYVCYVFLTLFLSTKIVH